MSPEDSCLREAVAEIRHPASFNITAVAEILPFNVDNWTADEETGGYYTLKCRKVSCAVGCVAFYQSRDPSENRIKFIPHQEAEPFYQCPDFVSIEDELSYEERLKLVGDKLSRGFTRTYKSRVLHGDEEQYEGCHEPDIRTEVEVWETAAAHPYLKRALVERYGLLNVWVGPTLERDHKKELLPNNYKVIYVRPGGILIHSEKVLRELIEHSIEQSDS